MTLFSLTVFFSAFLLFLVQPVIAKVLLPWFGGGASVWAVCLVFFQTALFLGYLYAHWSVRSLRPARQAQVHSGLIGASLLALFFLNHRWTFYDAGDPAFRILALLVLMVGLPYFTLSATGPLLQAWLALRGGSEAGGTAGIGGGVSPYRLYALSNAGSLLSLLGYPFLVEPYLTLRQQLGAWTVFYILFGILCAAVAARVRALPQPPLTAQAPGVQEKTEEPGYRQLLLWMALAACPSVLLLAITNHLTQNVAAIPFLWLLPLSLYLLSFIFCFGPGEWSWSKSFLPLPAMTIAAMAVALVAVSADPELKLLIPLFSAGLFVACLMCHGELARLKPHPEHLTAFYLMISLGGAAGSVFVGLIAPRLFSGFYELQFGIGAYALLAAGFVLYQKRYPIPGPYRVPLLLGLDVIAVTALMHTGGGVTSGIGGLLVVFVGAAALTLPGRHAFLAAALATLAVLGEQMLAFSQQLIDANDFIAAGMLGAVIFAIAAAAFPLARRLEESEALAHQRGMDLANLAQLNEYIIQNLRESIVVVDAANNLRLMNQPAAEQLGCSMRINGQPLRRVSPELSRLLEAWRGGRDAQAQQLPSFLSADGSTQINTYIAPLEGRSDGPVLVFLEDAGLLAEKVQQSKLAALGRLTASIAHEVRNPVGAMSHAGQLLEESTTSCSSRAARPPSRSCSRCAAGPAASSRNSPPPWSCSKARWPLRRARTWKCAWTRATCTRSSGTCARTR